MKIIGKKHLEYFGGQFPAQVTIPTALRPMFRGKQFINKGAPGYIDVLRFIVADLKAQKAQGLTPKALEDQTIKHSKGSEDAATNVNSSIVTLANNILN